MAVKINPRRPRHVGAVIRKHDPPPHTHTRVRCDPVTPPLTYSVTAIGNTKPRTLIGAAGHEQEEGRVGGKKQGEGNSQR